MIINKHNTKLLSRYEIYNYFAGKLIESKWHAPYVWGSKVQIKMKNISKIF